MENQIEPIMYPTISKEWAKQLAFDVMGKLDFANMKVEYVNRNPWVIAIPPLIDFSDYPIRTDQYGLEKVLINLKDVYDPINNEISAIGYEEKFNALLIYKLEAR